MDRDEMCQEELLNFTLSPDYENYSSFKDMKYPGPGVWKNVDYVDLIKIIAYVVIILGGLCGNVGVIVTVACNRSMRTTINIYVANLAVADAMICVMCMVPQMIAVVTTEVYILGEFMCKFNPFTQMTCLTSSVLTLSAISCDRFMAIMFPLHVRITKQRTSIVMTIIWIMSFLVSIPFLIVKKYLRIEWQDFIESKCSESWPRDTYYHETINECIYYEPLRDLYYVVVSITLFFLPALIMVTAYSLILWRLGKAQVPGEQHAANINVHSRAKKKVNKMVFVVLVAFIICWTPLQIMVLYSAFGHKPMIHGALPDWFPDFKWFSYYLAYANSFMNPIIYGGFNKTFREGFCAMLRCKYIQDKYGRSGTYSFFKSVTSMKTVVASLSNRTYSFFKRPKSKIPTYQAKLVKPMSDNDPKICSTKRPLQDDIYDRRRFQPFP